MAIRNLNAGERGIYMYNKKFMFVQRYDKGSSQSGQHRLIARFLPAPLTQDFLVYLVHIRPALTFFLKHFQDGFLQTQPSQVKHDASHFFPF
jgi:hypothetical protein